MDYTIEGYQIKRDRRELIYRKVVGKSGIVWVYPINVENKAEMIHCRKPGDYKSNGYGGSTITFLLEDGTELKLQGPWHSNCEAFYEDTGIDIRDTHYTFVVISKNRTTDSYYKWIMQDVIYIDEKPTLGKFDRGEDMAKELVKKLGHPVYLYAESSGGSRCCVIKGVEIEKE